MPLTPRQIEVVTAPTDSCILVNAGPGTGKTHVLVERFLYLTGEKRFKVDEVLVVTFGREAAREIKERLARRLLEEGRLTTTLALERAWISNFHGLCFRLLRENALLARFDPATRVLDLIESAEVSSQARNELLVSELAQQAINAEAQGNAIPSGVLERLSYRFDHAVKALDRAKENLLTASAFDGQSWAAELSALGNDPGMVEERATHESFLHALPEIERQYERKKAGETLVDFVDLQTRGVEFLRSPAGAPFRGKFRAILVDEFQDTNLVQMELLRLLSGDRLANVMAVGDSRQGIYSFRGARIENIRELPAKVREAGGECQVRDLTESYRSYQEILDVSRHALPTTEVGAALEAVALGSAITDQRAPRPVVRTIRMNDKTNEAERIAQEITALRGTSVTAIGRDGTRGGLALGWGHFALLLRSVQSARVYEQALRDQRIPYRTLGGTGFYDRREILDLLAYLKALANPYDGLALIRILQNPPFGLSDRSLYGLANVGLASSKDASEETDAHENKVIPGFRLKPYDALKRAIDEPAFARALGIAESTLPRLKRLWSFLERSVRRCGTVPVSRLLQDVLVETGYGKLLLADETRGPLEALRRRKNVERLLRLARRQEERNVYGSLEELISYMERALDEEVQEAEESIESDDRVVNVMTVHQAKGKEWPVVFVGGLTDKSWPMSGWPSEVVFFEGVGPVLRREVIGHEEGGKQKFDETRLHQRLAAGGATAKEHEERRLLFVAMTRAKNLLVLTTHGTRTSYFDRIEATLPASEAPAAPAAPPASTEQGDPQHEPKTLKQEIAAAMRTLGASAEVARPASFRPSQVNLSFSHVDLFDTCPLRYKFTFVLPLPGIGHARGLKPGTGNDPVEPSELAPTELGTLFHEALQRWAHEDRHLAEIVKDVVRDRGWPGLAPADEKSAGKFVENFLASRLGKKKPAPQDTELPFTLVLDSEGFAVTVTGSMDRIDREEDGTWTITDYKTNRGVEPERYGLQLSIYRLAAERVLGRRVGQCAAYFVQHAQERGLVEITPLSPAETERRIVEVARRIVDRDFEIGEHPGAATCWRCPFGGRDGFCPEKKLA